MKSNCCEDDTSELERLRQQVNRQAEDSKLWFGDDIDYVREKLRELHAIIEGELQ